MYIFSVPKRVFVTAFVVVLYNFSNLNKNC